MRGQNDRLHLTAIFIFSAELRGVSQTLPSMPARSHFGEARSNSSSGYSPAMCFQTSRTGSALSQSCHKIVPKLLACVPIAAATWIAVEPPNESLLVWTSYEFGLLSDLKSRPFPPRWIVFVVNAVIIINGSNSSLGKVSNGCGGAP
ncbi:hypothetical protein F2Q70_00011007 [Brassica cretica]|uniref:Uncharacterized protein n=1 Tax=Brassica cretica TaxID=69181 RepID=A0A8S9LZN1_BRACR|nr:hypothetical protein F2Q70_00011007 [Brassica cretica]